MRKRSDLLLDPRFGLVGERDGDFDEERRCCLTLEEEVEEDEEEEAVKD
jgi:hypothetical protein